MNTRLRTFVLLALLSDPLMLLAHPMGNFSINHHSKIHVSSGAVSITTILDFAEISTLELFPDPRRAADRGREFASRLRLQTSSGTVPLELRNVRSQIVSAPTGLPTLRVELELSAPWTPADTTLTFKDENYSSRIGWKEVVIDATDSLSFPDGNSYTTDKSNGLTVYPEDLMSAPPNVVTASVHISPAAGGPGAGRPGKRTALTLLLAVSISSFGLYFRRKGK
jgi:nickel/cobalt transporter (NicO) family protein